MHTEPGFHSPARKPLIAVVDDEVEICKALRRLLRAEGFEVQTFGSGQAFLEAVADVKPDCLIVDLHLPGLTGLELKCRLAARGANFPVIVITGADKPGLKERVLAAGVTAYFLKPVNDVELLGALATSLS